MRKQDPYCYPETSVLKNKFNIREVSLLEKAEADLSRAKMSILYESPVDKFDAQSFLRVHEFLFEEVYDWAGQLRTINISKPEEVLGGKSIWYEDALDLPESLDRACTAIVDTVWHIRDKRRFCAQLAHVFAPIWKVHPFREGNTRTVVAMMVMFIEHNGFYVDTQLVAECAGYVRDALVYASAAQPDFYPLTKFLNDAISRVPFDVTKKSAPEEQKRRESYKSYKGGRYYNYSHELRPETFEKDKYSV